MTGGIENTDTNASTYWDSDHVELEGEGYNQSLLSYGLQLD